MITGEDIGGMIVAACSLLYVALVMWATLHEDQPFWAAFLNPFGGIVRNSISEAQWRRLWRDYDGKPDA